MTVSTHAYKATLRTGNTTRELPITGGTITLDDASSPHVTGTLNIAFPGAWTETADPDPTAAGFGEEDFGEGTFGGMYATRVWTLDADAMASIDPRTSAHVVITADVTTDTYTHTRRFDLNLRSRDADHGDGTISLRLASDEALLMDWAPTDDDTHPINLRKSLREIANYVLGVVIPDASVSWATDADYAFTGDFDPDAFTWKAGQSAMDFLRTFLPVAGLRLVCDEQRGWTLRTADYVTGGSLTITHGVNALAATEGIDRDGNDWFDAAVTRYRWKDRDGQQQERVDAYALRSPHRRLRTFEMDAPYPGEGFSAYVTRRAQRRGREGTATVVADWRAQAEMPVVIQMPGAPNQTGRTGRVVFDLDRDEMTITTRTIDTPRTAWQFLPADEAWSYSPPGATWAGEDA